jgi:hypothetical protein
MKNTNQVNIVFIHFGSQSPPNYLIDALLIATRVAIQSKIYILLNEIYINSIKEDLMKQSKNSFNQENLNHLSFLKIEDLPKSECTKTFESTAKLDRNFRDGFWFSATYRFFILADFMSALDIENCIHLENDAVLYFDPTSKLDQLRAFANFAVPLDRVRAIPGIVWFKDAEIALNLCKFILNFPNSNDMDTLGDFAMRNDQGARPLPTIPLKYAKAKRMNLDRYCQGIDEFGGIFDAAAIGQYLGGVHWMNDSSDTRFFVNESSDFHTQECNFSWNHELYRTPCLQYNDEKTPILSLHIHAKDLLAFSPFNCTNSLQQEEYLTGERLQALADVTISSAMVISFHGREKILTPEVLEIPEKKQKRWFRKTKVEIAPDSAFLQTCQNGQIIFVYTHLINYFKKFIAPRLARPFTLITHNSDDAITVDHLSLLNHPLLKYWFAQNCEFSHEKLKSLPIGLANSQWGASRLVNLYQTSLVYQKTDLLYINFSSATHPGRKRIIDTISSMAGVTFGGAIPFEQYLIELAKHKFCLCPRGNGIDTHRFWEAQYLNTIPVVLQNDWTPAYSNLPILLVKSWEELAGIDLEKKYIEISCTQYDRSQLKLSYYSDQFNQARH